MQFRKHELQMKENEMTIVQRALLSKISLVLVLLTTYTVEAAATQKPGPGPQIVPGALRLRTLVTAEQIDHLGGVFTDVVPPLPTDFIADSLLTALGDFGPVGPSGPLGALGPIGDNSWNVTEVFKMFPDWSQWSHFLSLNGGPLSSQGPLGPNGPLSANAYEVLLPQINQYSRQLQAGGIWSVVGPLGPLGALGPLGPLGPVGAHGFKVDSHGNYTHQGQIVRQAQAFQDSDHPQSFDLYEKYDEDDAKKLKNNDTSFMVEGSISDAFTFYSEVDEYPFQANEDQIVTINVVPEVIGDNFTLEIATANGKVVASSSSPLYMNWIQLVVPKGTQLRARVKMLTSMTIAIKPYRLFVTGATTRFADTVIRIP